jgi:class 3 adenylate cyclase
LQTAERAILFADVTDSTTIYESLGDARALGLIDRLLQGLQADVVRAGGTVIKHLGDGIVCVFVDPGAAARTACDMQKAVAARDPEASRKLAIKVAFTFGPVVLAGDDVFGDTVNVCARLASIANSEQVLTNEQTLDALPPELRQRCRMLFPVRLKGRQETVTAYEMLWRADLDLTEANVMRARDVDTELKLAYAGTAVSIARDAGEVRLGRDKANDVVVTSNLASRFHARILPRGGHFVLADTSSNGTYLLADSGGREIVLRREEAVLGERGWIGLGRTASEHGEHALRFRIEPKGD